MQKLKTGRQPAMIEMQVCLRPERKRQFLNRTDEKIGACKGKPELFNFSKRVNSELLNGYCSLNSSQT